MPSMIDRLSRDYSNEIELKFDERGKEEEDKTKRTQLKQDELLHKYTSNERVSMIT